MIRKAKGLSLAPARPGNLSHPGRAPRGLALRRVVLALTAGALLVLALACSTAATPAPPVIPVQNAPPAPTPVPPEAKQTAQEFAQAHLQIEQDWDQIHNDFDQWRAGLASCAPAAADEALRGFASDFSAITRQAGNLPRSAETRGLADVLIEAAQDEETSLRRLRDRWHPDDDLFEAVDERRSMSLTAQTQVVDGLDDLLDPGDVETTEELLQDFSERLDDIGEDWEAIHTAYLKLRENEQDLSQATIVMELESILDDLAAIREAIDELPSAPFTKSTIRSLAKAVEKEEEGFVGLHEQFSSHLDDQGPAPGFSPSGFHSPAHSGASRLRRKATGTR